MAQDQQFVAKDFMGLGKMGDVKEKVGSRDGGIPLRLNKVDLGPLSGAAASINNGILFNHMAFTDNGLKHSFCSNAATFQQLLSSGSLQEGKVIEQSAESAPERTYMPLPHPAQAWWREDPFIKRSPAAGDDMGTKTQVVGGFGGSLPKNALSLPTQILHAPAGYVEAAQSLPAFKLVEKKDSAPLTIFYGGNVNVFNDVTAEKAQAIMFLANFGNLQGLSSAGVANGSPTNMGMTSPSMQGPSAVNKAILSLSVPNVSTINLASKIQRMDQQNVYNVENSQAGSNQAGFGSASMQLDLGHPDVPAPLSQEQLVVPTALPQARKASLARFLEKRRERVLSKSPYPSKQVDSSLPEERLSSSNDVTPYGPYSNTEEKKKVSLISWMERQADYSSDMVVKEDTKIVSV